MLAFVSSFVSLFLYLLVTHNSHYLKHNYVSLVGKSVAPKTLNDIKLIHLGKVLENNKTLSESGVRDGAFAGGVITMHVVIQPVLTKKKPGQFCHRYLVLVLGKEDMKVSPKEQLCILLRLSIRIYDMHLLLSNPKFPEICL